MESDYCSTTNSSSSSDINGNDSSSVVAADAAVAVAVAATNTSSTAAAPCRQQPAPKKTKIATSGIVDSESSVVGNILSLHDDPCDCMLVQLDTSGLIDNFYILQLIQSDEDKYVVFRRRGRTGFVGCYDMEDFDDEIKAIEYFEGIFKEMTGLDWANKSSATTVSTRNKYQLITQNFVEKSLGYNGATWQYWVADGVDGKAPAWYDYDTAAGRCVEQLYQEYILNSQLRYRVVKSGYWTYSIDLLQMTQTNVQHQNRTMRRIRRCPRLSSTFTQPSSTIQSSLTSPINANSFTNPNHTQEQKTPSETLTYNAPDDMAAIAISSIVPAVPKGGDDVEECVICLEEMKADEDIVKFNIVGCSHMFHRECIKKAVQQSKPCCPTCRLPINEVQGYGPSGTMSISTINRVCSGYEDSIGSIVIEYDMPGGIQNHYHPNPGVRFHGARRMAYLPDTNEGKALLARLKYSWMKGLSFTIGTSMTTGIPNSITWSSVHHKTSLDAGAIYHGFPDNYYFRNCNFELDALGVPSAPRLIQQNTSH